MRLTCPNCDAQYEVPDEVMPLEGRDVQCSACGCTWFEPHPDHPETAAPEAPDIDDDPDRNADPEFDSDDAGADLTGDDLAAGDEDAGEEDDTEDEPEDDHDWHGHAAEAPDAPPEPQAPPPQAPRRVGPEVSDILREEARREAELRAADALESQPDLGLDAHPGADADRRAREAETRKARMRGEPAEPAPTGTRTGGRRNVFPDIDDINATLRNGDRETRTDLGPVRAEPDQTPPRRKGSFLRGFAVALLLAAMLALIYTNAQRIADTVPGADPMLSAYVALVDQGRIWLDAQVGGMIRE